MVQVSIRLPAEMHKAFGSIADSLERGRAWVMLRAFRQYLENGGGDVLREAEGLAALDRGEGEGGSRDRPAAGGALVEVFQDDRRHVAAAVEDAAEAVEPGRRIWVMLRAFRQYLENEGGDILREAEGLAALDRGEGVDLDAVMDEVDGIVAQAEARHTPKGTR